MSIALLFNNRLTGFACQDIARGHDKCLVRVCGLLVFALVAALLASDAARAQSLPRSETDTATSVAIETVTQATSGSRIEPTAAGFVNAVQVFSYSPTDLYRIYTRPGRVTDIALQPGEQLVDIAGAELTRWTLGNTTSGKGEAQRTHISVKPARPDLATNLIIYTDRRTYYIEVTATPATWITAVAWEYPQDKYRALATTPESPVSTSDSEGAPLEKLDFRYEFSGPRVPWRPVRAFDDGSKVYIQFPPDIAQHDLPPLFLVGPRGTTQLVNYRVRSPYYIVDRLFDLAELRLGDRKSQAIRIKRLAAGKAP